MKKNILLTLIFGSSILGATAQDLNNDITVKYSHAVHRLNESRIGLEYRRAISPSFKMKFGTDYGKGNKDVWTGNNVIFGSDSITITRDLAAFSKTYSVYAGMDYEGFDYLSLGASFILGTNQTWLGAFDRGARYNPEDNTWENCIECAYEYHGEELPNNDNGNNPYWQYSSAIKSTNYLVYGLSLRAAIRIPIKNCFEFTAGYEPTFVKQKTQNVTDFQVYEETYSGDLSEFSLTTHSVTVALRYKF